MQENLRKGDLVIEMEPTPRRTWKMGLVLEPIPVKMVFLEKQRLKQQQ